MNHFYYISHVLRMIYGIYFYCLLIDEISVLRSQLYHTISLYIYHSHGYSIITMGMDHLLHMYVSYCISLLALASSSSLLPPESRHSFIQLNNQLNRLSTINDQRQHNKPSNKTCQHHQHRQVKLK